MQESGNGRNIVKRISQALNLEENHFDGTNGNVSYFNHVLMNQIIKLVPLVAMYKDI